MGIPKLNYWLREQQIQFDPNDPLDMGKPAISRSGHRRSPAKYEAELACEGLLVDLNDLLHYVAQRVYQYGEFSVSKTKEKPIDPKTTDLELEIKYMSELTKILELYIMNYQPRQYIIVAVDGPAPLAKIFQQRKRRFAEGGAMTTSRFSSMVLTPGTAFMGKIDLHLREWFENYENLPPYSVYSGHQIPGEGEHKMFKYLKESIRAGDIVEGKGLHIFFGQDGDLLMISALVPVNNLVWVKETREADSITPDPRSVIKFRNRITSMLGRDRMIDFVTMMFMYGNDFFPAHPAFKRSDISVETFTKAYIDLNRPIVDRDTGKINSKSLQIFFEFMAEREIVLINEIAREPLKDYEIMERNVSRDARGRVIDLDFVKFREDWYLRVLSEYHPEKLGDLSKIDEMPEDIFQGHIADMVQKMTSSYVDMLQWNIDYYRGDTNNISWTRAYPYAFAPLFTDLAKYTGTIRSSVDVDENVRAANMETDSPEGDDDFELITDIRTASIIRQLLMVIHPKILPSVVPRDYAKLVIDPDPKIAVLAKFSPEFPRFFPDGREEHHLWTSVMPIVDIETYDDAIATVRRRDLPSHMLIKNTPFTRKINSRGEITIVKSLPKMKAEDSKYQWTSKFLM